MDEDQTRADRHRRWLESLGLSARDWARIKRLAERTTPHRGTAALDDLDVPCRVGACMLGEESRFSGRLLGVYRGRALLWWPMSEPERQAWRRARRRPGAGP